MNGLMRPERCVALLAEVLGDDCQADPCGATEHRIYLALQGTETLEIGGYLVTEQESVDRVIAFCPVHQTQRISLRKELARQLWAARRVARREVTADSDDPGILWLRHEAGPLPMPSWVYGLACIPLTGRWNGQFETPCPFCPTVMARMAAQPEAIWWLRDRPWTEMAKQNDTDDGCDAGVGLGGGAG